MPSTYFSYLIRIWKDPTSKPASWRASLEVPSTNETVYFHTVRECLNFLQTLESKEDASGMQKSPRAIPKKDFHLE